MDEKISVQTPEDAHLLANHDFYRLGEFFGIKDPETRRANQKSLERVLEWAKKQSDSNDIIDVLLKIRSVERTLGTDSEPRLAKLTRYIALQGEQEKITKEMELLKNE